MFGLDGLCPGSLLASVSGLICFAQLDGTSLNRLHHIALLCVDHIFGSSDGDVNRGFWCCRWSLYWEMPEGSPLLASSGAELQLGLSQE